METFKKRQKEMRRLDRQKEKAERRFQKKQNRAASAGDTSSDDTRNAGPDSSSPVEPNTDALVLEIEAVPGLGDNSEGRRSGSQVQGI
jgi:hypothetical protein